MVLDQVKRGALVLNEERERPPHLYLITEKKGEKVTCHDGTTKKVFTLEEILNMTRFQFVRWIPEDEVIKVEKSTCVAHPRPLHLTVIK